MRRATYPIISLLIIPLFLSTLSLRRATISQLQCRIGRKYFYPRSPCGERPYDGLIASANFCNFYPRSPCGERLHLFFMIFNLFRFLSTLSLRRATPMTLRHCTTYLFLSTLSLRRATRQRFMGQLYCNQFLSTLSLRRATTRRDSRQHPAGISIHALLAESDYLVRSQHPNWEISIHALLAESDCMTHMQKSCVSTFLSTLSLRRATLVIPYLILRKLFLSTLSLRRATSDAPSSAP